MEQIRAKGQQTVFKTRRYIYEHLNENQNEIRLVTLLSGSFSDDIHVLLHKSRLTEDDVPTFEALSYTWGDVQDTPNVYVGSDTSCTLTVVRNLETALRYLRYEDKNRTIWIDAICIDQENLKERGQQVERMCDIFRLAERVVVWIGVEAKDSTYALELMTDLSFKIEIDWQSQIMFSSTAGVSESHWADRTQILPYEEREMSALAALFDREWFERLWIRQEIQLAKENAILMCGQDVMLWQAFKKAVFCLNFKTYERKSLGAKALTFYNRIELIFQLSADMSVTSFGMLARNTQDCKCTDVRDRVYAQLSIHATFVREMGIKPDYRKTKSEVYQDAVLCAMDNLKSMDMLRYCEMRQDFDQEMSSWVPDWATKNVVNPLWFNLAAAGSFANGRYVGQGVLAVTGAKGATIQRCNKITFTNTSSSQILSVIKRHAPVNVHNEPYVAGGSLLEAYCRTLTCNSFAEEYIPAAEHLPRFEQTLHSLPSVLKHSEGDQVDLPADDATLRYLYQLWKNWTGRAFFTATEGYIGLAPSSARPGDVICIILGCESPLCLRPSPTSPTHFQVVGECYVWGLMDGEALIGPLGPQFKRITALDDFSKRYATAFQDIQSGSIQRGDPRLGALCKTLSEKEHSENSSDMDKLEEYLRSPVMLRQRGTPLRDFHLI